MGGSVEVSNVLTNVIFYKYIEVFSPGIHFPALLLAKKSIYPYPLPDFMNIRNIAITRLRSSTSTSSVSELRTGKSLTSR
jgi:hypothetical protein